MGKTRGECCNPFGDAQHKKFQLVYEITAAFAKKAKSVNARIKKTDIICKPCKKRIERSIRNKSESVSTVAGVFSVTDVSNTMQPMDVDNEPIEPTNESDVEAEVDMDHESIVQVRKCLSELLLALGLAQIDNAKIRGKKYQEQVLADMNNRLHVVLFTKAAVPNNDCELIISQLKKKFDESTDRDTKIKVLSICCPIWSTAKVHEIFGGSASIYMINQTKELVKQQGILCNTVKKIGSKTLDENTRNIVQEHYRSDDISRASPGMRDCVSYRENGERVSVQRRLIMMNLKEAYELFKAKYSECKIGFSKFATLRPLECVLASSASGIHVTCVCVYHQNPKLIVDALKNSGLIEREKSYRDLIQLILCADASDKCRMNECSECPGMEPLQSFLYAAFDEKLIEKLNYNQWMSSGCKSQIP